LRREPPRIAVVGSINLDLVARCGRLPRPGETVGEAVLERAPGGKAANQAVACARLGATVRMIGAVATDDLASAATSTLESDGVDVSAVQRIAGPGVHTGVAFVLVDEAGENQIVVAPGVNRLLDARAVEIGDVDAVLTQLEIPDDAVLAAAAQAPFLCLNAAPARTPVVEPDLLVVNRYEHEVVGDHGRLVALTLGADGACAAGALAASRPGAQPSLPTAAEIDAILGR
jgi:ribokinase